MRLSRSCAKILLWKITIRQLRTDEKKVYIQFEVSDMDGVEIATRIRAEFGASLPIIATAYDVSEFEAAARGAGVNKMSPSLCSSQTCLIFW